MISVEVCARTRIKTVHEKITHKRNILNLFRNTP
jgi:hypothetical protein